MKNWKATRYRFCRWCGEAYEAQKEVERDGFCKPAHKQAHYRAYKKYVTARAAAAAQPARHRVTHKKKKKRANRNKK